MLWSTWSPDEMNAEFRAHEAQIAELRNRQAVIVNEFEKASVAAGAGCRSTVEYVSGRFDVSRAVASDLTFVAGRFGRHRWIEGSLLAGEVKSPVASRQSPEGALAIGSGASLDERLPSSNSAAGSATRDWGLATVALLLWRLRSAGCRVAMSGRCLWIGLCRSSRRWMSRRGV